MPTPSLWFLEAQTAAEFGVALDEFQRKSLHARAQMVAFLIARNTRDAWLDYQRRKKADNTPTGFNPVDVQRRKWKL